MNEEEKQVPQTSQTSQVSQVSQVPQTPEEIDAPEEEKSSSPAPLGGRSVFAYLAVLFGAAFLLLLFAYLMQQRDSAEIMGNLSQLRESMGSIQSIDELTEENRVLREEKEALEKQVSGLEEQLVQAQADLSVSKSMEEQWYGRLEVAQGTLDALDTLAYLQALCDQDREDEAREKLEFILSDRDADGKPFDRVEYYLSDYVSKYAGDLVSSQLEVYNPLEEWRTLKEVLTEEEDAG